MFNLHCHFGRCVCPTWASLQAGSQAAVFVRWHYHQKIMQGDEFWQTFKRQTGGSTVNYLTKETMDCWEETGSKSNPASDIGYLSGNTTKTLAWSWLLESYDWFFLLWNSSCDPENRCISSMYLYVYIYIYLCLDITALRYIFYIYAYIILSTLVFYKDLILFEIACNYLIRQWLQWNLKPMIPSLPNPLVEEVLFSIWTHYLESIHVFHYTLGKKLNQKKTWEVWQVQMIFGISIGQWL